MNSVYVIYKTINLKTRQYYIGVHKTQSINDSYMGSGIHIIRQIKKYGKYNFCKKILFEYDNKIDAYNKEIELVDVFKKDKKCLNIANGGIGGSNFKGRKHTKETKKKLSEIAKKNPNILPKEKIKEVIKKGIKTRYQKNNGKYFSPETIEKIREKAISREKKKRLIAG